jgi:hypothetical protein
MKTKLVIVTLLTFGSLFGNWVEISENSNRKLFEHNSYGKETTEIQFSLNGYEFETVTKNDEDFQKISYFNEGKFIETGKPALPRFSRLIAIPNEGEVSFEIFYLEDEIIPNMTIYPRQSLQIESQINSKEFVIDEAYYNSEEVFPGKIVEIGEPAIMRDYRVVNITVNPFQYDPKNRELRVVKNVDIVVNTSGRSGENIKIRDRKKSRYFEHLYQATILNYDSIVSRNDEFQQPCYLFIYPDNSTIENTLQSLAEWKHQKGFDVVMASTAQTGTSLYSIKNYIQDAYNNWENPPEFICLVGDAGGSYNISTDHCGGGEGDHGYVRLDGNDILADAFIGRLSIASNSNLQNIIYKILHYEKEPYMGTTDWYNTALLVGDPTDSGPSCIDTKQHIKEMIDVSHPNINSIEVYNAPWVNQMSTNLNIGVTYFNYRGFWGMSGWSTSNINSLNNGLMMPFAVALTCETGDFEGSYDCISEAFLKAGSPGNPKGAIGAISTATPYTHTCFNNCIDAGIYYGIFRDGIYHMGGALNRGKLNLYLNYPQNPMNAVNNFSYWNNLMGDPGLELWTGIPQDMIVTYDTQVALGTNFLEVTVEDENGIPLQDAWVTALMGDDDIFATGYTDEDGFIILPIDAQLEGSVNLTVTKHDFIPHLGSFDIGISDRFVNVFEITIDDDNSGTSSGNGDGIINPGENIELNVSLKNFGTMTAADVTATISTENEFITITDNTEDYGNIAAGSSVYSSDDFDFSVGASVVGGTGIQINIVIQDALRNQWTDFIFIPIEGANLYVSDYTVVNDPNGVLDPGETVELVVNLENLGTVTANVISGELFSSDPRIIIEDPDGYFGNVPAGGQASNNTNKFEVTANAQIIPGSQFTLELHLFNAEGYDNIISFPIYVGTVSITDPVGPDAYGYYCYDDGDIDYYNVPVYDWIEINQLGTELTLYDNGDMGDTEDISLPITFKFYGEEYNTATICSNGWLTPGHTDINSFMNWYIPGPPGPSPIIAPFWDDLKMGSGDVYWYYDSTQNYVIVEWDHLQNDYNNAEETFQVILYDSNFYPTSTGDSEIKFQYKVVNNVDQGSYGGGWYVYHGQYATVGIEDHTGTVGLEYTFSNSYPVAAKPLQNQMALLFTGPPIPLEEPFIVLGGITINDSNGNGQVDYAEDVDLDIILNNLGENPATGVSALISTNDQYLTITHDTSTYNTISGGGSGINVTDFSLSVAEDCPDCHIVPFELFVTSNEDDWTLYFTLELNAPVIEFNSVLVDDGQNNILDPGETADLLVSYENVGGSDAYNVGSVITTNDPYLTINSATFDFGTFSSGVIATAIYNVSADINTPVGHGAVVDWLINGDYNYSSTGDFTLAISQVPVLITENFNTFPPTGWSVTSTSGQINWAQGSGSSAGGTPPEAKFSWSPPTVAIQRLITMPINTMGSASLELEFQHSINHFGGPYELRVETTSDGSNWNTVATWPAQNLPATTENFTITTPDVGSETFQLAFTFDGNSDNINNWYVDDVIIEGGNPQTVGYIGGEISLVGGTGNIEDVEIIAGSYQTHPDENGDYLMPVIPGTYDVSASLAGYETITVNNVNVIQNQIVTVDFELAYLEIPINLTATVESNDVTLEWDMPVDGECTERIPKQNMRRQKDQRRLITSEKSIEGEVAENRSLTGYKIYRDGNEITEITDPSTTIYIDEFLAAGDYSYYVTAIYDCSNESLPSNTENVNIILEPATNLTATSQPPDILLNWVAPASERFLTGYKVYRDGSSIAEVTETTYLDENVPNGTYTYYVTAAYGPFESEPSNEETLEHTKVNLEIIPLKTTLNGNYPNPFNPETNISFTLSSNGKTLLEIFNIKGEKVSKLIDKHLDSGYYSVVWNGKDDFGRDLASGIYFYKFQTKKYSSIKKMILLK